VQAEIYAGVSYVSGEWYDDSAYKSKNAVGVPIGACVLLAPTREIGIGIGAFQNFNGVKSFSGGSMVFTFWR
jgi:hypothetical protein